MSFSRRLFPSRCRVSGKRAVAALKTLFLSSLFPSTFLFPTSPLMFFSFFFFVFTDEAVEQVQGNQHPISGVCGRSNGESGVSKRSAGGQR